VIISRRMIWVGHMARMGRRGMHARFGWGESEGRRPFWRHGCRWQDNGKMDLKKKWGGM
jgi:hypothetical protein